MTATTNGRSPAHGLSMAVVGLLLSILGYLAVEVRAQVRGLERDVAASDRTIAVLLADLDHIKTSLLRIENRLERRP